MSLKNLTAAIRAPFWSRFGLGLAADRPDCAYDNAFTLRWRNAANTADIDVLTVNSSDEIHFATGLTLDGATVFSGSVTVGDAVTDGLILKGRVSTGTAAGSALSLGPSYTYGEGVELRYTIATWGGFGNQFNGLY